MHPPFWQWPFLLPDGWGARYWVILVGAVGCVLIHAYFQWLDPVPGGIVQFELAGTPATANMILDRWGEDGRARAFRNLLVDFAFILCYTAALSAACAACAQSAYAKDATAPLIGFALAWGVWVAGACDAVENLALLQLLPTPYTTVPDGSPWPRVAQVAAAIKFGLFFAAVGYLVCVGLSAVCGLFAHTQPPPAELP